MPGNNALKFLLGVISFEEIHISMHGTLLSGQRISVISCTVYAQSAQWTSNFPQWPFIWLEAQSLQSSKY